MENISDSARHSGWLHYPGEVWDERKPVHWGNDGDFWEFCAEQYAAGEAILELACGNGRITRRLVSRGYEVFAVDVNAHFLNRAVNHLSGTQGQVHFFLQDIARLDLPAAGINRQFKLALMADWTFPVLLTQQDQISFLARLHSHLVTDGVFIFDTLLPALLQIGLQLSASGMLEWMETGHTFDPIRQVETYFSGDQMMQRRHTTLGEIELLATLTGFEIIAHYGGFDRRPLTGKAGDIMVLVLGKR